MSNRQYYRNAEQFDYQSTLECPDCKASVHVGTAGHKNLNAHCASKACRARAKANGNRKPPKPNQVLESFFKLRAPLNPPQVAAPAPIHAAEANKRATEIGHLVEMIPAPSPAQQGQERGCRRGLQLLQNLKTAMKRIPDDVPSATPEDCLGVFAVEPSTCVAESEEEDWPIVNTMLKSSFGWGEAEMATAVPQMLKHGEYGLDGFIKFMKYYVVERSLQGVMFETKIEALIRELESR